jgi:hypothetical protein
MVSCKNDKVFIEFFVLFLISFCLIVYNICYFQPRVHEDEMARKNILSRYLHKFSSKKIRPEPNKEDFLVVI